MNWYDICGSALRVWQGLTIGFRLTDLRGKNVESLLAAYEVLTEDAEEDGWSVDIDRGSINGPRARHLGAMIFQKPNSQTDHQWDTPSGFKWWIKWSSNWIYIYIYSIYIYIFLYIYTCIHVYVYMCICVYVYVCLYQLILHCSWISPELPVFCPVRRQDDIPAKSKEVINLEEVSEKREAKVLQGVGVTGKGRRRGRCGWVWCDGFWQIPIDLWNLTCCLKGCLKGQLKGYPTSLDISNRSWSIWAIWDEAQI